MTKTTIQTAVEAAQSAVNTRHGLTNAEMEKAIVAAFQSLIPYRYVWEEKRYIEDTYRFDDIWDEQMDDVAPKPHPIIRNVKALYLAPDGACCHVEPLSHEKLDRLSRDVVYIIPRELTDEEWNEIKYNVDRKADPDIPLWRIKEVVKYAGFIAGGRGMEMVKNHD